MENDRAYITFLGYCLDTTKEIPSCVAHIDWDGLYTFALKQTIIGIYAHTILEDNQALEEIGWMGNKLSLLQIKKWMSIYMRYKSRNTKMNMKAVEVSRKLEADGFRTCILKGQANAAYYPYPLARTPGDIDIWVMNQQGLSFSKHREKVINYFLKFGIPLNIAFHHIEYETEGISIEGHFTPSITSNPTWNKHLQKFYKEISENSILYPINLAENIGPINVQNAQFNVIFLLEHTFHHFIDSGIGFRQIIDYYYLLKNIKWDEPDNNLWSCNKDKSINILKSIGCYKFACALAWVLKNILGLDDSFLYCEPNKKEGTFLYHEIIRSGNFGVKNALSQTISKHKSHLVRFLIREKFMFRTLFHYPKAVIPSPLYNILEYIKILKFKKLGRNDTLI